MADDGGAGERKSLDNAVTALVRVAEQDNGYRAVPYERARAQGMREFVKNLDDDGRRDLETALQEYKIGQAKSAVGYDAGELYDKLICIMRWADTEEPDVAATELMALRRRLENGEHPDLCCSEELPRYDYAPDFRVKVLRKYNGSPREVRQQIKAEALQMILHDSQMPYERKQQFIKRYSRKSSRRIAKALRDPERLARRMARYDALLSATKVPRKVIKLAYCVLTMPTSIRRLRDSQEANTEDIVALGVTGSIFCLTLDAILLGGVASSALYALPAAVTVVSGVYEVGRAYVRHAAKGRATIVKQLPAPRDERRRDSTPPPALPEP